MHTPQLPIQISGASNAPNTQRAKGGASEGNNPFSQTLSREIEQRHKSMPAPAPAKQATPAKAQPSAPPEQSGAPKQAAAEPARPPETGNANGNGASAAGQDGAAEAAADQAAQAAQAAAATPVADMLALVASFNQLAGAVPLTPAAAAAALMAGQGLRPDQPQATLVRSLPGAAPLMGTPGAPSAPADVEGAAATPDAPFTNMMAAQDGGALDAAAAKSAPGAELPAMARPQDSATDGGPAARAAGPAPAPALDAGKVMLDPSQFANLRARDALPEARPQAELQVGAPLAAPVQQAALSVANAAAGVGAGDKIAARVGTPGWDNQVAQKIVWMAAGQEHSATLTLNPPDMGPMQVVLSVTNDLATVTFSSATPEVRQALQDAMPKLRDMMSESGIALGNATVNDGSAQQQAQDQPGRGRATGGQIDHASGSAAEAAAKVAARPARGGALPGMVDTFA